MQKVKKFRQFINEASFSGRAWQGKLENLDNLFSWLYSQNILSRDEQDEKDELFRAYYRFYNDGDTPTNIEIESDESEEQALERSLDDFMKKVLSKYAGKYDRRKFHYDQLLSQLYTIKRNLVGNDNEIFDNNINSFLYFYKKLGKVNHPDFDKKVIALEKLFKKFNTDADKIIVQYRKDHPELKSFEGPDTNKIVGSKRATMKEYGIFDDNLKKTFDQMDAASKDLAEIITSVIEGVNKAKAMIG